MPHTGQSAHPHRQRWWAGGILALIAAVGLTGCSQDGGAVAGAAASSAAKADADGPVTLTFWTWMTNIDQVVDVWNREHPDIQVKAQNLAEGDDLVTKLVTAKDAGNLPDLMQVEYQSLPVLVANGIAADITDQVQPMKSEMPQSVWDQVTWNNQTYAVPGDIAPMMLFYRADRFDQLGLTVPTTWDQFADDAKKAHEADSNCYLTSFSPKYPSWFAGLAQQAGAQWWSTQGNAWDVTINDEPTQKVAQYWGNLISQGLVSTDETYSAQWNSDIADGDLIAWVAPVWAAAVIQGIAPDTDGEWRAAPIPQWNANDDVTGYWGGSAAAISSTSTHKQQDMEFLTWLYTSPEGLKGLVDTAGLYPAATAGQQYALTTSTPSLLQGQSDFWQLAAHAAQTAASVTWSPNVSATFTMMQDAFSAAIQADTPFTDAIDSVQQQSKADLKQQGYRLVQ